tara:strand:- start:5936 stop:6727 length:792 start_codon:yes stop_codon:yes gene_type:complete
MKLMIANKTRFAIFVSIFHNLSKFSDSINIYFTDERLYIQGMDNSHCSMFEIQILADWFTTYECEESVTIGITSSVLYRVLNTHDENQNVFMGCEKDGCNLNIQFKNTKENQKSFPKEFEIPLMDIETELLHVPESEYEVTIKMPIKSFSTVVDQLSIFGDNMNVEINDEPLMNLSSNGHEGKMCVNMMSENMDCVDEFIITTGVNISLQYSLKYIQLFTNFSKVNKDVMLKMSNGIPMEVFFDLDESEGSFARFFLAPRIDD